MSRIPSDESQERVRTEEAWRKMQAKIAAEPANPKWAAWAAQPEQDVMHDIPAVHEKERINTMLQGEAVETAKLHNEPAPSGKMKRRKLQGRRKWGMAAAACVLVGAMLATPLGDKALAAILDKFKMQDVTLVNENDARDLYNTFMQNGEISKNVNHYGEFQNEGGSVQGVYSQEEAARLLGYELAGLSPDHAGTKVTIMPSDTLTFKLNVDEVNKALKRLGAEQLLPESIDGKPITLMQPERVYVDLNKDNKWSNLTIQKVPVVTVDPSIDVEEAVEAVLNFPLLPDYLKEDLKRSRILSGAIPMPLFTDGQSEKLTIEGTTVVLEEHTYGKRASYRATWVKDGQLYNFEGGDRYVEREAFLTRLKELM